MHRVDLRFCLPSSLSFQILPPFSTFFGVRVKSSFRPTLLQEEERKKKGNLNDTFFFLFLRIHSLDRKIGLGEILFFFATSSFFVFSSTLG